MKLIKSFITILILIPSLYIFGQSYDHNFIRTQILREYEQDENVVDELAVGEKSEIISYKDGIGRTLQIINRQSSPVSMKDLTFFNKYDERLGR